MLLPPPVGLRPPYAGSSTKPAPSINRSTQTHGGPFCAPIGGPDWTPIDTYGLVNLSAGLVSRDDRYKLTFQVRNLFDQSFAAAITNGGPGQAYRYQIPRDADRYFGVTGRVNF